VRIAFVTATFPPIACGIGDYTFHLSGELGRSHEVTVVTTRRGNLQQPPGVELVRPFDGGDPKSVFAIVGELERLRPDWAVVQYDPYSYGTRHAFNPYLPAALALLRRRVPETRIAVVVHETFPEAKTLKAAVAQTWQRAQLLTLCRTAHLGIFVVEAWAKRFRSWAPRLRVAHVPVGNNIPRVPVDKRTLRAELGVPADAFVLGWLGRTHPTLDPDWVRQAIAGVELAGRKPFVVHVGVGAPDAERLLAGIPSKIASVQPAPEISRHLSVLDLYLAPMREGISTRRTSVVAALSHGLPVLAASGPATDSIFREHHREAIWLVDPAHGESFGEASAHLVRSPELREQLANGAAAFALRAFSWPAIASELLAAMRAAA
jgi:glycosyltransferase involved in cell wall biosynthesis